MSPSHKLTHSLRRNIGWTLLIVALLLVPTLKWGGLLQASESKVSAAATPWKAASKPRTPQYIGRGSQHKIQVSDQTVASELESNGASLLADYGSYKLYETDLTTAQTLHDAERGEIRDESNLILLNAGIIDTAREEVQALRRNVGKASGKTTGMRLVQFVGPVKPEWHDALSRTGVRIVTYIPNNAYLVYADGAALANLREWAANSDFVQWDGEYTAAHRVDPSFDRVRQLKAQANVGKIQNSRLSAALADFDQVIVQLVSDPNTTKTRSIPLNSNSARKQSFATRRNMVTSISSPNCPRELLPKRQPKIWRRVPTWFPSNRTKRRSKWTSARI